MQWHSLIIVFILNYFLFSLSQLTKVELKAYESFESYNQFATGWVKEVKRKLFLNYLMKLLWLLDWSVRNVFPSSFCFSILTRCIVFIASAKILEREGRIFSSSFVQLIITSVSSIYLVDEFLFLILLFLPHRATQQLWSVFN